MEVNASVPQDYYQKRYQDFIRGAYAEQLLCFHQLFDCFPFLFPPVEPDISWYHRQDYFELLLSNYESEKALGHSLYEKKISGGDAELVFNVVPVQKQDRLVFNEFLFRHYSKAETVLQEQVTALDEVAAIRVLQVSARISQLMQTFNWIPNALKQQPASIKTRFLQVVHIGMQAARNGMQDLQTVRKKHVEQYLFSYGFILVRHFNWLVRLQKQLDVLPATQHLSLESKVKLMEELGILDYLSNRLSQDKDDKDLNDRMARIISLITSGATSHYLYVYETIDKRKK